MDRDDIIRIAKEAGWTIGPATLSGLERFASLVVTQNRLWVDLTDEEKSDIWCVVTGRHFVTEDTHVYADAIEAKLKDKNT